MYTTAEEPTPTEETTTEPEVKEEVASNVDTPAVEKEDEPVKVKEEKAAPPVKTEAAVVEESKVTTHTLYRAVRVSFQEIVCGFGSVESVGMDGGREEIGKHAVRASVFSFPRMNHDPAVVCSEYKTLLDHWAPGEIVHWDALGR